MNNSVSKGKLFLAGFGAVCLALAVVNSFIPNFGIAQTILLDGLFLLFSLVLAVGDRGAKKVKIAAAFVVSLILYEAACLFVLPLLAVCPPIVAVSAELCSKSVIVGAVFLISAKVLSVNIFNKKFALMLCAGLVLLLVLRIVLFQAFESSYYGSLVNFSDNNGALDYLSALSAPAYIGIIGDLFSFSVPTVFGASAWLDK